MYLNCISVNLQAPNLKPSPKTQNLSENQEVTEVANRCHWDTGTIWEHV